MKADCKIDNMGNLVIDLYDVFKTFDDDQKREFLEWYTFEEVVEAIERQLRHETDYSCWSTSGHIDGAELRAAIMQAQGIEPEYKKDLESKIRALERDAERYKKFYDWFFQAYHYDGGQLHAKLVKAIGDPTRK